MQVTILGWHMSLPVFPNLPDDCCLLCWCAPQYYRLWFPKHVYPIQRCNHRERELQQVRYTALHCV